MQSRLSSSARRVQQALHDSGYAYQVQETETPTRSAAEAAALVGCELGQIAKSMIFRAVESGRGVLVITGGANRVNEQLVAAEVGESIVRADPQFVRDQTGYAIGGVPPLGHRERLVVFVDRDLLRWDEIWAAGGTPNALFKLRSADLVTMTGGRVIDVSVRRE
jgi:prolyl-tRNA editing enzyme YbaK/EbsC (Cys-tRNA(Pro) deacylase)